MPYTYIMNIREMLDHFLHNRLLKSLISDKEGFSDFMYKKLKRYDKPEGLVAAQNEKGYVFHLIDKFSQEWIADEFVFNFIPSPCIVIFLEASSITKVA